MSERSPRPHEQPRTAAEVLATLDLGADLEATWVVRGQYGPEGLVERIGLLRAGAVLVDAWMVPAQRHRLVRALAAQRPVRVGEWDVMYATGWSVAWSTDAGPFEAFTPGGPLARVEGEGLWIRGGRTLALDELQRVEVYLSADWVERGVQLRLTSGEEVEVESQREPFALFDPTYDGIDLMFDASWAESLGQALARGLGVDLEVAEDLR